MTFRFSLFIVALAFCSLSANGQLQKINTLAGSGIAGYGGDGFSATGANLWGPTDVTLDSNRNVYIVDFNNYRIRKVDAASGIITTVVGTGIAGNNGNGSLGTSAEIVAQSVAFDRRGNLYFSDHLNNIIRKVNRFGIISKYAGGGTGGATPTYGYTGDGGKADTARFNRPLGIAVDDTGNLYVADAGNHVIRRIDSSGHITTFAGMGTPGFSGDLLPAVMAQLDSPIAVAIDHYGSVYINDYNNNVIRVVDTGVINTYAGVNTMAGYNGDGMAATLAQLNDARGLAVDTAGNLYIADARNNRIRKVNRATGIMTTAAGNGSAGFMGDLGYVDGCNLFNPYGVAVDKYGSIYIADANNNRVRKTYNTTGIQNITTNINVSVYPNPGSGQVAISGLSKADRINVCDITGKQVCTWQSANDGTQSFDIAHLSPGVYMLQVADMAGNRKATEKLVKE